MTADSDEPLPGGRLPIGGSALQCKLAEAAIDLFYARGALATTVREITGACGLTPGALYNHFSSKEHLLYVLVRDIHLQVDRADGRGSSPARAPTRPSSSTATVRFLVAHTAGFKKQSRVANREFTVLTGTRRRRSGPSAARCATGSAGILLDGAQQGVFSLVGGNDAAVRDAVLGHHHQHVRAHQRVDARALPARHRRSAGPLRADGAAPRWRRRRAAAIGGRSRQAVCVAPISALKSAGSMLPPDSTTTVRPAAADTRRTAAPRAARHR